MSRVFFGTLVVEGCIWWRGIIQFLMAVTCIGLVGAGLYMSLEHSARDIVLAKPGSPGRLVANGSSATAFFEMDGDRMELTMLFSDEDDPSSVFRTRVVLTNGQSHSIVVADGEDGSGDQRFIFHRKGDKVAMSVGKDDALTASLRIER